MARISKPGLDYFPLDVNFLQDRKVRRISCRHHAAGIAALTSLLCLIYKEKGYYILWNKVTTKKRNAERYSDRIELQGFQSCFRLFVKPSQSPLKPNQDAATLLVRNHARNGDKRTRITKQGVKD